MSVAGTYDLVTRTPMGDQKGTFTVVQDGGTFSGTIANALMGSLDVAGTVDGNRLTWTMAIKVPMPMTLDCEATVDGDTIAGTAKAGVFGSLGLSGTRAG